MVLIVPNPKTSHCCICKVADRDLAAFHAIEEALLNSSRARGNGKPSCSAVAKQFAYLWPDKKQDNIRKRLEHHFNNHLSDKMQEVREEEKEITRDLNKIADDFIDLCMKNGEDARKWAFAKAQKDPRDLMFSSNAAAPAGNLLNKLILPEKPDSSKGKAAIIEFMERERQNEASSPQH